MNIIKLKLTANSIYALENYQATDPMNTGVGFLNKGKKILMGVDSDAPKIFFKSSSNIL